MTPDTTAAITLTQVIDRMMREDRGRLMAAIVDQLRDFQLAEDALQDALLAGAVHWARNGLPKSPRAWLLTVARRKALDRLRQRKAEQRTLTQLTTLAGDDLQPEAESIPDERLKLIFTCCHPALDQKSQVALTRRMIVGLSTTEIAQAFLDQDTTMGQRLSRAKAKISAAGIPYVVPEPDEWPARLNAALAVIYLVFNAGYSGETARARELSGEAIHLSRMLMLLRPDDPEIEGCLALLLLTNARRDARIDADGLIVPPERQDRSLWRHDEISEGLNLVETALRRGRPRPYQIKAAIAACHCENMASDWPQIAALYDVLMRLEPTPVVRLNRAVAFAQAGNLAFGLAELVEIAPEMSNYQPFFAAKAALYARDGQIAEAAEAYDIALRLSSTTAERRFLEAQRASLTGIVQRNGA